MEKELLVCHRRQKKQDGGEFDRYFCYELDEAGEIVINPATGKGKGIKAVVADEVLKAHNLTTQDFPIIMKVDMDATLKVKDRDGKELEIKACKLKIDRKKDGTPRLDKYGKRHVICKINQVLETREAPNREITWDDVMDFE